MSLFRTSMKGCPMDLNLVVVAGRLAVEPEFTIFESGSTVMRLLVTVRSSTPRARIDVIPVTLWDPDAALVADPPKRGDRAMVAGSVERRFWSSSNVRQSRVEIIANEVAFPDEDFVFKSEAAP